MKTIDEGVDSDAYRADRKTSVFVRTHMFPSGQDNLVKGCGDD